MGLGALATPIVFASAVAHAQVEEAVPVSAEADARAQELFLVGDDLYAQGRYEEAIAAFEEAYQLSRRPLLLFNLANAQERAGRWSDALASLEAFAPHAPPEEQAIVRGRVTSLRERIIRLEQLRQPARAPVDEPNDATEEAEVVEEGAMQSAPSASEPRLESARRSAAGPVLLATSGVLLVGAAVSAIIAGAARGDQRSWCEQVGNRRLCLEEARPFVDRDRAASLATDLLLGMTAITAVTGVVLWVRDRGRRHSASSADVAVAAGSVGVAVHIRGSF